MRHATAQSVGVAFIAAVLVSCSGEASPPTPAPALLKEVADKYRTMSSYSAAGTVISEIDMSAAGGALPIKPTDPQQAAQIQQSLAQPQKLTHEFSILLARPSLYRIEWVQTVSKFTNKGAVWSAGEGDFFQMSAMGGEPQKPTSRGMALASATGVSGGAAHTVPAMFFEDAEVGVGLEAMQNPAYEKDESIEGDPCYVVSGTMANQKMVYWISKGELLVRQRRHILGGKTTVPEMTDEQLAEGLKGQGQEATPEKIAQVKQQLKIAAEMSSKIKGSITETHRQIKIDESLARERFEPK